MSTIELCSGRVIDLKRPEALGIDEIARPLSNICRFTGHTKYHYSVAQHSVIGSYFVKPENAFTFLMHDATEAVLGDVSSSLKKLLPEYQKLERAWWECLADQYGLPYVLPDDVRYVDSTLMIQTEKLALFDYEILRYRKNPIKYARNVIKATHEICKLSPEVVRNRFIERYFQLVRQV